jgi:hypothetical protein
MLNALAPIGRRVPAWLACACAIAVLVAGGCGPSKGNLAGKLKVEAGPELAEQGLNVKDWGLSGDNFTIKLEATKDLGPDWLLTIQADGDPTFETMTPLKMKAGQAEWIEIGGPKFLESFKVSSDTKTVKVGLHNRLRMR